MVLCETGGYQENVKKVFTCGEKTYQWHCVECDFSRLPWDSNSSATQTEPASDRPETGNRMQFYRRYPDDRHQENDWHDKRCSKTSHDKNKNSTRPLAMTSNFCPRTSTFFKIFSAHLNITGWWQITGRVGLVRIFEPYPTNADKKWHLN